MIEAKTTGRRRASGPVDHACSAPVPPGPRPTNAASCPSGGQELRRPRGDARRRALESPVPPVDLFRRLLSEAALDAVAPAAAGPYMGQRFSTAMRYGIPVAEPRASTIPAEGDDAEDAAWGFPGKPAPLPAPAAQEAPDGPASRTDGPYFLEPDRSHVADLTVRVQRDTLGLSHKIAAVAAVSGLALAAAYPALGSGASEEELAATASGTVDDVVVADTGDYEVERASLKSTFSKDDQLDHIMTASQGEVTRVDTGGALAQPLDQVRVTSRFGVRPDPWGGGGTVTHIGQDYGVQCGTPVKAAASGTVVQAGWAGHSGNRVRVDHGNGLETTYNHNTAVKVSVGQKISRGDVVSLSGTTGNSTGCHLHFEVLVDGTAVDPAGWL